MILSGFIGFFSEHSDLSAFWGQRNTHIIISNSLIKDKQTRGDTETHRGGNTETYRGDTEIHRGGHRKMCRRTKMLAIQPELFWSSFFKQFHFMFTN